MTDQNRGGTEQSPRRRGQGELEAQVLAVLRQAPGAGYRGLGPGAPRRRPRLHHGDHHPDPAARQGRGRPRRAGRSFEWTAVADEAGLAALRMRKVLDAESDREAVLASFLTSLTPGDEQVLRDLLAQDPGEGEG